MSRGIYSVYLSEAEEAAVRELAHRNGASVNFAIRCAVREFLGLPAPRLERPGGLVDAAKVATSNH